MQILTYFIALLVLSGCAHDFRALYATETRIVKETEYDQGMRNHIDKLQKGPKVAGSDCFVLYPFMGVGPLEKSEKLAIRKAIEKAGSPYNGLSYVNVTLTIYPSPVSWSCFSVNGTATIDQPYIVK